MEANRTKSAPATASAKLHKKKNVQMQASCIYRTTPKLPSIAVRNSSVFPESPIPFKWEYSLHNHLNPLWREAKTSIELALLGWTARHTYRSEATDHNVESEKKTHTCWPMQRTSLQKGAPINWRVCVSVCVSKPMNLCHATAFTRRKILSGRCSLTFYVSSANFRPDT